MKKFCVIYTDKETGKVILTHIVKAHFLAVAIRKSGQYLQTYGICLVSDVQIDTEEI